ncbi:ABC transporter ATP-binding protein [Phytoactinopolyspora alkaliphila]|uniref:ABC transporter ATP-binding protein n=1 Tax=Phytoactinopolyspora alkaliphila TaxID=1783498 RepID=A0A6N9YN83_9ACTN|nr:ABC transporter ATP-binding protein [Phytoactinopolyspora alkaliphila]NED96380.1 ABC transporter ATP-binding protein [Phytoactinopolyspora alkaliphila]
MTSLLEVANLTVRFARGDGGAAVSDVSLSVHEGETLGVVGESGCGKTTTARAVLRLLPRGTAVSGSVRFGGRDLLGMPKRELRRLRWHELALVPQSAMNSLDPVRTVESQFIEIIRVHVRCSRREARRTVHAALADVGIDPDRGSSYPHQFSGGMRQRALIAMATVLRPRLLIADEPTTGLDVIVQDQVLRTLEQVQQRHGLAVLLVTHDLGVVAEMCDRIAVIRQGEIVEVGTVSEVILNPQHEYTARLIAAAGHHAQTTAEERAVALASTPGTERDR